MTPNAQILAELSKHLNTLFNKAHDNAPTSYKAISTIVPSSTRDEEYGWLGAMPAMREWLGERIVHGLSVEGFRLRNLDFEATVSISRNDVEDDRYGIYAPIIQQMGMDAADQPDKLVLSLLKNGFTSLCYDGQNFFDSDHPVGGAGADVPVTSVSNTGGGSGAAWFLLDCSRAVKPLVFQDRKRPELLALNDPRDANVFFKNEYIYGVHSRCNAGYGLWQLAYGSKQALDAANYGTARAAMMSVRKDNGEPRNVRPTHLVVPPSLEAQGRALLYGETYQGVGAALPNPWKGTAELIVSPHVI